MSARPPFPAASRPGLYRLGVLSALKALALAVFAEAVVTGMVSAVTGSGNLTGALQVAAAAAVVRAVSVWAQQVQARRTALGAKEDLRHRLAERLVRDGGHDGGQGAGAVLAARGLDALDNYYTQFLPALVSCAVVPLLIGARILLADWVSALIVVLTVPLVPLFMVLIGQHTVQRTAEAATALSRLSNHLLELAKGLPVLVGLGRARAQTEALRTVSEEYRSTTLATLRVAFLSSLALELISTISVALVAVFVGVRLVHGELDLATGLLVLVLAPECYLPLRELGTAHHASDDGREALARADAVLHRPEVPALADVNQQGSEGHGTRPVDLVVSGLRVRYQDRRHPVLKGIGFRAPAGQITALAGPSGCGKSTLLHVLTGQLRTGEGVEVAGTVCGLDSDRVAWVPQHPATVTDTVRAEVLFYAAVPAGSGAAGTETAIGGVAVAADGKPDTARDAAVSGALALVGISALAERHPAELSPGELRRLALARALVRIDGGATVLLLDEPTAHLDAASAGIVERVIASLRNRVTVVLVAHAAGTLALADQVVQLVGADGGKDLPAETMSVPASPAEAGLLTAGIEAGLTAVTGVAAAGAEAEREPPVPLATRLRVLVRVLEPWRPAFLLAVLCSVLATLSALALTGLSGWLIVRASQQPPILYLLVAITGVRFFGLTRAVARYWERLLLHDALFAALTRLRVRVWQSLSHRILARRSLLRGEGAVDHLIGDLDTVRDLAPRVVLPPVAGLFCAVAVAVSTGLLLPAALPAQVAVLAAALLVCPLLAARVDGAASAAEVLHRSTVLRRITAMLGAANDLRANRAERGVLDGVRAADSAATAAVRKATRSEGLAQGLLVLSTAIGALAVLAIGSPLVATGTLPAEVLAGLVLLNLALFDAFTGVAGAVRLWPALNTVLARFAVDLLPDPPHGARLPGGDRFPGTDTRPEKRLSTGDTPVEAEELARGVRLSSVTAAWPDAPAPVLTNLDVAVGPGDWLTVTGPSGSGKSTLLAVLLGFLPPVSGTRTAGGRIAWCPQQGHLFDSSLRANLLLARPRNSAPTEAELLQSLAAVGLEPLLAELPAGLDTGIGPSGSRLSGGQRQRVAVARTLLAGADVVLLDEPTAHLDSAAAESLMRDLRAGLSDKAVVLVTHDAAACSDGDDVLALSLTAGPRATDAVTLVR
ncbi:MAG: transporter [Micrococcaceae bacterium]|nr:transporter [Micrococcaceae bacterium]